MKSLVALFIVFGCFIAASARECVAPRTSQYVFLVKATNRVKGRGYNRNYEPGGTIVYACAHGYAYQSGNTVIRCQLDGSWSGSPLTCKWTRICEKPRTRQNAYIVRRSSKSAQVSAGDYITYSCLRGFKLRGQGTIRCTSGGVWTNNPPTCVPDRGSNRG